MRTVLFLAAIWAAPIAQAGQFQYECEVLEDASIQIGHVEQLKDSLLKGQRFTISRESGEVVGSVAFAMSPQHGWKQFSVLDRGSKNQSFKLLAVSPGPFTNVVYLEVKEYENGQSKSFVHYTNFGISIGVCR